MNYHYHVITEDEEIARNEYKGASALVLLKLHPELKWFLGMNPLSCWVFPRIKKESALYAFFERAYKKNWPLLNRIGAWFLKEYAYLKGALKT